MKRSLEALLQTLIDDGIVPYSEQPKIELNGKYGAYQETPLHAYAIQGDLEACQILISSGAEVNALGEHNFTPLHEAISQGHLKVTELLLKNGANTEIETDCGSTESLACDYPEILKLIQS